MPSLDLLLPEIAAALFQRYGHAETVSGTIDPFEAMAGTVLNRALGPKNGGSVLQCLKDAELLSPARLAEIDLIELADAVGHGGISRTAKPLSTLQRLAQWIVDNSDAPNLLPGDTARSSAELREELASVRGIGLSGADAVLLHGLNRPAYAVDRASMRIIVRHGWADLSTTYDEARQLFIEAASLMAQDAEATQTSILAGLSSAMSQVGRQYCRAAAPRCVGCPLEPLLPDAGPLELDS